MTKWQAGVRRYNLYWKYRHLAPNKRSWFKAVREFYRGWTEHD